MASSKLAARYVVTKLDLSQQYTCIARKPYPCYSFVVTSRRRTEFEWDTAKDLDNQEKHGVSFLLAQYAFADPDRVILEDVTHSTESEERFYCLGLVGEGILTVRFTFRENRIRIFGAGYWRKGRRIYDEQNQL